MRPRPLPYHTLFSHAHLRTPTSSRPSHPLHAFCFGLVVLQRRLFRRHSSSKSKHDNQLHPEAEKLRAAA